MRDQEHSGVVELWREVVEEVSRPVDNLAVAFSTGEGLVDPAHALNVDLRDRPPVQRAVVALAETPVLAHRNFGAAEGDLGSLDGTRQIRREDHVDPVVSPALAECARKTASCL
jgi:hypothetical protein